MSIVMERYNPTIEPVKVLESVSDTGQHETHSSGAKGSNHSELNASCLNAAEAGHYSGDQASLGDLVDFPVDDDGIIRLEDVKIKIPLPLRLTSITSYDDFNSSPSLSYRYRGTSHRISSAFPTPSGSVWAQVDASMENEGEEFLEKVCRTPLLLKQGVSKMTCTEVKLVSPLTSQILQRIRIV